MKLIAEYLKMLFYNFDYFHNGRGSKFDKLSIAAMIVILIGCLIIVAAAVGVGKPLIH